MKISSTGSKLTVEFTAREGVALCRILSALAKVDLGTEDPEGKAAATLYVKLAGAVEAFTGDSVLGLRDTLAALDGDEGDAVEGNGRHAKLWRLAFDDARGPIK